MSDPGDEMWGLEDWPPDGRCEECGEDEVEGGSDGGKCLNCGHENPPVKLSGKQ